MMEEENAAEPHAALRRKLFIKRIMHILLIKFLVLLKKLILDILRNLIYSLKPNIFCPIFVSSSQRLAKVASPPLPESTTVDSKNLPRKSSIFLSKAGYARCLFKYLC